MTATITAPSFDAVPGLRESHGDVVDEAARVAADLAPLAAEADELSTLHRPTLDVLRDSGILRHMVPARWGGRRERVDPVSVCIVREALMGVSSHADSLFGLQGIGSHGIALVGTDEQRDRWLPKVAAGEVLAAFAVSEDGAGSDVKRMTTTLEERGGRLRLDGQKSFISNAGIAGYYEVIAREGDGFSAVLVEADTPGLTTEPAPELLAPHVVGRVRFDGVELPASARLGAPGAGFEVALGTLAMFRISVAAGAVGLAQRALDEAARHAAEREQFGRPLVRLGPVAGLLADSWADVASARLLTYHTAAIAAADPRAHLQHSSLAKLAATEACSRVVDRAVQVCGRWGLVRGSQVERCYRQSRAMRIYEGASEVLRLGIAQQLCQEVTR
ncbi:MULTISPECIES: acyl-CoA dehydrogenase family protein [unclassified Pseudonocardia]|mgnify:FL=1|uniref:acyl-CoA dehydrogenase family protein n=1 Tax=unclassified Pseudonocardia TaxID=2619320 RepID=UPI000ABE7BC4|nr:MULTISPECIES: acyl-CoA dehydrogenase family protein [unclassified Pseudonocardia]